MSHSARSDQATRPPTSTGEQMPDRFGEQKGGQKGQQYGKMLRPSLFSLSTLTSD